MTSGDAYERLRAALKTELQKHFGRINEIEAQLSRSPGYLSKFCRGDISIPIEVLFRSLELLQKEPGQFFIQALGTLPDSSAYLRGLAADTPSKGLARLESTAVRLTTEIDEDEDRTLAFDPSPDPRPAQTLELVDAILECSGIEQRRRLRSARRYRSRHFVEAYLNRLYGVSYDDPRTVIKQAEVVGAELVPKLEDEPAILRLSMILRALAVYGFAQRLMGPFDRAASAALVGLRLGRRYRLDRETGEILKVAAYVLGDHGHFAQALQMLGEALVIFDELDDEESTAKVQVQRGIMYVYLGDYLSASRALQKALRRLPGESNPTTRRYRLTAYQGLAMAWENAGDPDRAEQWLDQACEQFQDDGAAFRGKLLWSKGRIAEMRQDLPRAFQLYTEARRILADAGAAEQILVSLHITRALLGLGRHQEACQQAMEMGSLLGLLKKNKVAEGALVEFMRTAIEAKLSLASIANLEKVLVDSAPMHATFGR